MRVRVRGLVLICHRRLVGLFALQLSATGVVPGARGRQASRFAGVADLKVELDVGGLSHAVYK